MTTPTATDPLCFTVRVDALVDLENLEEEDQDVPGDYDIRLNEEARGWTSSKQATAVLDEFHNSVAIGMLEDFEISVLNSKGEEIFEEDED